MTEGAWITVAVTIAGGSATLVAAIIKAPFRRNGNGVSDPNKCPAHSGLVAEIRALKDSQERIEQGQDKIWSGIDEIRRDVRTIAAERRRP